MEALLITCIALLPIILIVASYRISVSHYDVMDGIFFMFMGSIPVGITTMCLIEYTADKYL